MQKALLGAMMTVIESFSANHSALEAGKHGSGGSGNLRHSAVQQAYLTGMLVTTYIHPATMALRNALTNATCTSRTVLTNVCHELWRNVTSLCIEYE